ncbi:MAG TPA: hypothetical protein VIV58_09545 [Kofleriaceae bacterium]
MLKASRKLHLWIGLLFAPSLIFFALSGTLQMFGLHESEGGQPAPAWIAKLAEIHKIQSIATQPQRAPRPAPAATPAPAAAPAPHVERAQPHRSIPLLVWFVGLAVGLVASTGFGIYMAFAYKRDRAVVLGLLAAGIVIPIVLAFL